MTLSTQPDNKCNICPRRCNIDRTHNKGYCLMNDKIMAARAALHMWEEPCISGERGSGAIFFSIAFIIGIVKCVGVTRLILSALLSCRRSITSLSSSTDNSFPTFAEAIS